MRQLPSFFILGPDGLFFVVAACLTDVLFFFCLDAKEKRTKKRKNQELHFRGYSGGHDGGRAGTRFAQTACPSFRRRTPPPLYAPTVRLN